MIDRRRFSFGALLAVGAASTVARAEVQRDLPAMGASFRATQRKGVLEVRVTLANQTDAPLDVQTMLGSRPGPRLEARRVGAPEGEMLAEIVKFDRKEMISRMGPPPTYVAVAPGASVEVGPYKFETPEGPVSEVELRLTAYTERDIVEMAPVVIAVAG